MGFPLKPLVGNKKDDKEFWVFDIEGRDWIDFLIIGLYDGHTYTSHEDKSGLLEFFEEIIYRMQEKEISSIDIFAHFGGKYDFLFLLEESIKRLDPKLFKTVSIIKRGSGILCFDIVHTIHKKKSAETYKINFKDSSAFLPMGLKKLTDSFDVKHKKGELDHSKTTVVTDEMRDYLKDDCRGLYEVIEKYRKWPLIKRSGFKTTTASQALQVFRTFMNREIQSLPSSIDTFVRKGYSGGRTEIFKYHYDGSSKNPLNCYDVNSLYPYVMRNNEFPTSEASFVYAYMPEIQGFYEASVFVPEMYAPPLPVTMKIGANNKLIFPTGTLQGVWSTAELEYARSVGCKILKTGKGVVFESGGYIFKEYIDRLYQMRMDAKNKGDGVGDIITKLLMNSLYGRFGLRAERENISFIESDEGKSNIWNSIYNEQTRELTNLYSVNVKINSFSNVGVAAWVTAHSRILMHQYYSKCGNDIWYTDTDSLFTNKKFPNSSELGGLKLEGKWDKASFILPKTYAVESKDDRKTVMKGMDKEQAKKFTPKDFLDFIEGDLRMLSTTTTSRIATMSVALNSSGSFLMKSKPMTKRIMSKYDKRLMFKQNGVWDSRAWDIKDGVIR